MLLLGAHLGLVLQVDVAPPAEQDQRDIQGQRGAGDADLASEILTREAQVVEEGVAVPDEQQDGGNQDGKDHRVAPRADQTRSRRDRLDRGVGARHATELVDYA